MRHFLIFLLSMILTIGVSAQSFNESDYKSNNEDTTNIEQTNNNSGVEELGISALEFQLSLIVLGFGLLVICIEAVLVWKRKFNQNNLVKFIIVTLIITGTLFLITAGYDNNQIAPAVGLLGTIAGYMLGKHEKDDKEEKV